ncbi:glycosyltransferase [Scytonema hofmannii FACHB-248]|uniref:Glycosyltransferase n=1 Tax=Scytonema hofmannii FACHB-248 TaxID=1842502 RepID=A0ABR8GZ22_9CYAN|nr:MULTISPECIES: glycosyltransferase [Nostocales]MBD2608489.1 glycosyltransferase [Scytonema hofmannii FACHB-248]
MQILFLHPNFPAQFRHVAAALAKDSSNQVFFGSTRHEGSLPGVNKVFYKPKREARPETHHYVRPLENAVLQGQAVFRMAEQLKAKGFVPDVVYGHSGWGPTLFIKDIFPEAKFLCYFEWFYHAHGSDADFDPNDPLSYDDEARIRIKNAPILQDLYSCDRGLSPTYWQRQQFPSEYQRKISVLHDGIDTEFFRPKSGAKLVIASKNIDLSHVDEIVTYATRGMEPYRGFPQFIEAVSLLQQRRPNCHVVVVGENRVAYGKKLADGKTYKDVMLDKFPIDQSRIHFTGWLPYEEYLQVLQASSVHVYLTRPFVLSWSLLESLCTGCLVVGSRTPPVMEVIQDGVNGLLADFFSPQEICDRIEEALNHPDKMAQIRAKARETVEKSYNLSVLLPKHLQWLQQQQENTTLVFPSSAVQIESKVSSITENSLGSKYQHIEIIKSPSTEVLQVNNRKVTAQEIVPLLIQYQMLPKLKQELVIEEAIASFTCTPEEEAKCHEEFCQQHQLTSEIKRQSWLQEQGLTEAQFIELTTRKFRVEKFQKATWGSCLESYFRQRKQQLDQVIYSLIRLKDADLAREIYFRLLEDEQPFAELARQYSQGTEVSTGGLIGPVPFSSPHPKLAQILTISQLGQLSPPTRIGEWWIIVRLEKLLPAKLDEAMKEKLLNELFTTWLQEQLEPVTAKQQPLEIKQSA